MTAGPSVSVAFGVASRSAHKLLKSPGPALPPMIIPLFFFAAFTGALSAVGKTRDFGYFNYTTFVFVFVLYQAAIFAAVFTAFDVVSDYAGGVGRRLMLAAPRRMAIIGGYLIVGLGRGVLAVAVVWAVALATGMPVRGEAGEVAGVVVLALLLNVATTLYGAGIALRFKSSASGVLIILPAFVALFLTPLFTPRHKLTGVLEAAASVNPLTPPIEAGRGFLADRPVSVALAFGAAAGLVIALAAWAVLGMRKAEQSA